MATKKLQALLGKDKVRLEAINSFCLEAINSFYLEMINFAPSAFVWHDNTNESR